jgi:hypothetical protein
MGPVYRQDLNLVAIKKKTCESEAISRRVIDVM